MKKPINKKCICKYCNNTFFSADVKANVCYNCKSLFVCQVCGKYLGRPGKNFCMKHSISPLKGKTYKEIHGTDTPKCGYQKGEKNIAKRPDIKKKISEGVKKSYTPELREIKRQYAIKHLKEGKWGGYNKKIESEGIMFRSQFEVDVKNILNELGIGWKYEKQLRIGERCLLPDFTITTNDYFSNFVSNNVNKTILLEVTGASYKRWRQGFLKRLDYIVEHDKEDKYRIFVVTYPDVYHFFSFLENKYNGKVHVFSFGKPNIKKHERYIEIEDITNIDYSHFLPWHNKCGKIHGHSSKVSVKIGGILGLESKPWLIDFGKAKQIVKDICNSYDHKLLVDRNSVSSLKEKENVFEVTYLMKDGSEYFFKLPSHTIKVLNNSSTAENLSMNIAEEIGNNLPDNLYYVEVKLNEGFDNTSQATFVKQGPEERMFGNYDFIKCLKYHLVY